MEGRSVEGGDDGDGGGTERPARLWAALGAAGIGPERVAGHRELGGGTFNTVFRVGLDDGTGLVVKLAPAGLPLLRYESGILAAEAAFYELAGERTAVPLPRALSPAGRHHLVMSECPGTPWSEWAAENTVDDATRARLRGELGCHVAALHTITGPGFGYPAEPFGPLTGRWRDAFLGMVGGVLDDAVRFGAELPRPVTEIRRLFAQHADMLDEIGTPRLVHFDLWDGNILVDVGHGPDARPRIGALIDAERAFWGDPVADFVSLALFGDIEDDEDFLAGYRAAGGPAVLDGPARRRLALYRAYLWLIMWVEAGPRGYDREYRGRLEDQVVRPLATTLDAWASGREAPGG